MSPGYSPDIELPNFTYFPYNADKLLLSIKLKSLSYCHENVYQICHIVGNTHIWDQFLTLGIFHEQLQLLTTAEYVLALNLYKPNNRSPLNTRWEQLLTKLATGIHTAQINYTDLCDTLSCSNLLGIPAYDWDDLMTNIILKSNQLINK